MCPQRCGPRMTGNATGATRCADGTGVQLCSARHAVSAVAGYSCSGPACGVPGRQVLRVAGAATLCPALSPTLCSFCLMRTWSQVKDVLLWCWPRFLLIIIVSPFRLHCCFSFRVFSPCNCYFSVLVFPISPVQSVLLGCS